MTPLFIFLDLVAIFSLLVGIFTSSLILFIIARKLIRHHIITNILLANTCICTLELCLSDLIIYINILMNDIQSSIFIPNIYDQQNLCPIRSYFLFTGFALLYTSYCLQAYYRLRLVIFYRKNDNYKTFIYLCLFQWIFSFLLVLPMLITQSFVYIPEDFFCPIPFTKPISVLYIAICVYGIFLIVFTSIYFSIYIYATRITMITLKRRRIINRQLTMLKRIILPACSLLFLGIVYLSLFTQTIINQYQTHFLTYRLSYLFIAIGMSFIHIITILQTPSIKAAVLDSFYNMKQQIWRNEENRNNVIHNSSLITECQQRKQEDSASVNLQGNNFLLINGQNTIPIQMSLTEEETLLKKTDIENSFIE
ncbi:unnamed protein product [Adineta steineri]|uniref:G-protein coupled receptors family 1 profile domain-containing protein n=2 Tax=Adineta steineri TaxID=433720 RepID=A0A814RRL9_9BILA|nr:unnamed protein product [Adineta steineri]